MMSTIINELFERYPQLESINSEIWRGYEIILDACKNGRRVLVAGNGGSASDAEHIVGELMKGFCKKRPLSSELVLSIEQAVPTNFAKLYISKLQHPIDAVSLVSHSALITAFANDVDADLIFAQQVLGYGKVDDVLIVLTTSGNSKNIVHAAYVAKALGINVIAFTGKDGGLIKNIADVALVVPAFSTLKIQELHLPIYHAYCKAVEAEMFED